PAPADGARPRLRVIASNAVAVSAMAEGGVRAVMRPLQGAPEEIVHDLFALAAGVAPGSGRAFGLEPRPSDALLAGPENDAPVDGAGGAALTLRAPLVAGAAGPRHADLGLRFAMLARDRRLAGPWVLLLTASDGGGAAGLAPGVVVDSGTLADLAAAGIDAEEARRRGRAAEVLEWIGAVYRSGPTGTDVGDLAVFLRGCARLSRGGGKRRSGRARRAAACPAERRRAAPGRRGWHGRRRHAPHGPRSRSGRGIPGAAAIPRASCRGRARRSRCPRARSGGKGQAGRPRAHGSRSARPR